VSALLGHPGVAANARNVEGTTPLHYLARRTEESEGLEKLFERFGNSLDFAASNHSGETALHFACSQPNVTLPSLLLKQGADPNAKVSRKMSISLIWFLFDFF
jgi:ankyrin repeat protein